MAPVPLLNKMCWLRGKRRRNGLINKLRGKEGETEDDKRVASTMQSNCIIEEIDLDGNIINVNMSDNESFEENEDQTKKEYYPFVVHNNGQDKKSNLYARYKDETHLWNREMLANAAEFVLSNIRNEMNSDLQNNTQNINNREQRVRTELRHKLMKIMRQYQKQHRDKNHKALSCISKNYFESDYEISLAVDKLMRMFHRFDLDEKY